MQAGGEEAPGGRAPPGPNVPAARRDSQPGAAAILSEADPGRRGRGEGSCAALPGANLRGLVPVTVLFIAPVAPSALRVRGGGGIVGPDSPR